MTTHKEVEKTVVHNIGVCVNRYKRKQMNYYEFKHEVEKNLRAMKDFEDRNRLAGLF